MKTTNLLLQTNVPMTSKQMNGIACWIAFQCIVNQVWYNIQYINDKMSDNVLQYIRLCDNLFWH